MLGPYTIYQMTMLLYEWNPNFKMKGNTIRMIPLWTILP